MSLFSDIRSKSHWNQFGGCSSNCRRFCIMYTAPGSWSTPEVLEGNRKPSHRSPGRQDVTENWALPQGSNKLKNRKTGHWTHNQRNTSGWLLDAWAQIQFQGAILHASAFCKEEGLTALFRLARGDGVWCFYYSGRYNWPSLVGNTLEVSLTYRVVLNVLNHRHSRVEGLIPSCSTPKGRSFHETQFLEADLNARMNMAGALGFIQAFCRCWVAISSKAGEPPQPPEPSHKPKKHLWELSYMNLNMMHVIACCTNTDTAGAFGTQQLEVRIMWGMDADPTAPSFSHEYPSNFSVMSWSLSLGSVKPQEQPMIVKLCANGDTTPLGLAAILGCLSPEGGCDRSWNIMKHPYKRFRHIAQSL